MTDKEFLNAVTGGKDILAVFLEILGQVDAAYCVIGGLAVNAYVEPIVSLDLDIAVAAEKIDELCRAAQDRGMKVEPFEQSLNLQAQGFDSANPDSKEMSGIKISSRRCPDQDGVGVYDAGGRAGGCVGGQGLGLQRPFAPAEQAAERPRGYSSISRVLSPSIDGYSWRSFDAILIRFDHLANPPTGIV